ncbi:hypothetical protein G6L37_34710 [Agrobacterium rubi]|nr:hypothetical protein [Agrobacterium rubi]NTF23720.1 hypothetical protein [Agrobacterium rubi]
MARLFYHATDAVFDRFDPALKGSKGASNGHLGVWVGNEKSECEMFGDVLMTLSLDRDVVAYPMDYEELLMLHRRSLRMSDEEASVYWKEIVEGLMADGYNVIDLHELTGVVHSVLMDLDSIVVEAHDFKETPKSSSWGRG